LPGIKVDGTKVFEVYDTVLGAVERARKGEGATVSEAKMYRLTPHSSDDDRSYRSREEVEAHKKQDPILLTKQALLDEGLLDEESYEAMEVKAKAEVDAAVKAAMDAASIAEWGFMDLDAPVRRLAGPDVPAVPFSHPMQEWFMVSPEKIADAVRDLAAF